MSGQLSRADLERLAESVRRAVAVGITVREVARALQRIAPHVRRLAARQRDQLFVAQFHEMQRRRARERFTR